MCDFGTLNQEGIILKIVSVGLDAESGSQASSKVKRKRKIIPGIRPREAQGRAFTSFPLMKRVDEPALHRCRAYRKGRCNTVK